MDSLTRMSERRQQVEDLFWLALEREPHEREVFLKEACAGDEALLSEVKSLLEDDELAQGFMEEPIFPNLLTGEQGQDIIGSEIGRYEVIGELGVGAAGKVYLARDNKLSRFVALKFFTRRFPAGDDDFNNFSQEAITTSALNHPNIITVYDTGEFRSWRYIASEYVEGETLRERLSRGRLSIEEAIGIGIQVARALAAAHKAGVIHRDIKPENIMIRPDNLVKVLDFGIAKISPKIPPEHLNLEEGLTDKGLVKSSGGVLKGTAQYMSPEQARAIEVTAQSDVWSLGTVLFEMLTGLAPFVGENLFDTLHEIHRKELPPLRSLVEDVPDDLQIIIDKSLARDLNSRYRTVKEFQQDLENLQRVLKLRSEGYITELTPRLVTGQESVPCPYRGLYKFDEEHAVFFKGRDAAVKELLKAVEKRHFVTYTSASGGGKSSLIFAGLFPLLRKGNKWIVISLRPWAEPFQALADAIIRTTEPHLPAGRHEHKVSELLRQLRSSKNFLCSKADQILRNAAGMRLLVVIDQFEELFVNCDQSLFRKFLDTMSEFAEYCRRSKGRAHLLISLRVDFLERSPKNHNFTGAIINADLRLKPMDRDEMGEAIRLPAALSGLQIESGLAERIIADMGDRASALPLLEFTLERLWQNRQGTRLTHTAYNALGGVREALAGYAEEVYLGLSPDQQVLARKILLNLVAVSPSEGQASPSRRLIHRSRMDVHEWQLTMDLVNARLLTTNRDPASGGETVELIHEALITEWKRCADWVQQHREFLTWREQLNLLLKKYRSHKKNPHDLLHGPDLHEAERWLGESQDASSPYSLSDDEVQFIQDSRQRERQSQRRAWRNRILAVAGLAAIVSFVIVGWRWYSERSIDSAAHDLLAQSLAIVKDRPDMLNDSVLLAIESYRRRPTSQAYQTIYSGMQTLARLRLAANHECFVYSPDGKLLITAGKDRTVRFWDLDAVSEVKKFEYPASIFDIAISQDGKYLAVAGDNNKALLVDAGTGKVLAELPHPDAIQSMVFSPDGRFLATTGTGKDLREVHVWEVPSGLTMPDLSHETGIIRKATFSPDGNYLATVVDDLDGEVASGVYLWDTKTRRNTFLPHDAFVMDAEFSPDGRFIATGGKESVIRIYDVETKKEAKRIQQKEPINVLHFSKDGRLILTGNELYLVGTGEPFYTSRVFDLATGREVSKFKHADDVHSVAFSPDSKYAVSGSYSPFVRDSKDTARVWDINDGREVSRTVSDGSIDVSFTPDGRFVVTKGSDQIQAVYETPDGSKEVSNGNVPYLITRSEVHGTQATGSTQMKIEKFIRVWDPFSPALEVARVEAGGADWNNVAVSQNGRFVAGYGEDEHRIQVWDLTGMKKVSSIPCSGMVGNLTVSNDGQFVAAGIEQMPQRRSVVNVWSTSTGERLLSREHDDWVTHLELSSDGRYLAELSKGVRIVDVKQGRETAVLSHPGTAVMSFTFSPDDKYVAIGGNNNLSTWDLATGRELNVMSFSGVTYLAISHDGKRIAAPSGAPGESRVVMVIDVDTKKEIARFQHDSKNVSGLVFSPDDRYLKTSGENASAYFWEVSTGREIARINDSESVLSFRFDGLLLTLGDKGVSVKKWLPADVINEACARLTRNFTVEEWQRYLPDEPYHRTCENLP